MPPYFSFLVCIPVCDTYDLLCSECREGSLVLCGLTLNQCRMASTAYSGPDGKWLVQTLVIEFFVVDRPILDPVSLYQ